MKRTHDTPIIVNPSASTNGHHAEETTNGHAPPGVGRRKVLGLIGATGVVAVSAAVLERNKLLRAVGLRDTSPTAPPIQAVHDWNADATTAIYATPADKSSDPNRFNELLAAIARSQDRFGVLLGDNRHPSIYTANVEVVSLSGLTSSQIEDRGPDAASDVLNQLPPSSAPRIVYVDSLVQYGGDWSSTSVFSFKNTSVVFLRYPHTRFCIVNRDLVMEPEGMDFLEPDHPLFFDTANIQAWLLANGVESRDYGRDDIVSSVTGIHREKHPVGPPVTALKINANGSYSRQLNSMIGINGPAQVEEALRAKAAAAFAQRIPLGVPTGATQRVSRLGDPHVPRPVQVFYRPYENGLVASWLNQSRQQVSHVVLGDNAKQFLDNPTIGIPTADTRIFPNGTITTPFTRSTLSGRWDFNGGKTNRLSLDAMHSTRQLELQLKLTNH